MNVTLALQTSPIGTSRAHASSAVAAPEMLAALPAPAQFASLTELIKLVLKVSAVSIDFHGEPTTAEGGLYRSFLEIPLIDGDETIGALRVLDSEPRDFTDRDCTLLEGFAKLAVDQVVLWAEASRDVLTGAMTRRAFEDVMRKTFAARQRNSAKSSLVVFDLDHFKAINDTWGHTAGDEVLRATARTVLRELRTEDSFGRLGGEEFGIIVAHADGETATDVAERIRRAIARTRIPGFDQIEVTASFGVAELSDAMPTSEDWMSVADEQLYLAKDEGRDRVCRASGPFRVAVLN